MITHKMKNNTVRIVSDEGNGNLKVQDVHTKEEFVADVHDLTANGGLVEIHGVLAKISHRQARLVKQTYVASNKLSVHEMRKAGHRVRVMHYRYGYLNVQFDNAYTLSREHNKAVVKKMTCGQKHMATVRSLETKELVLVPSMYRETFRFFERGGSTIIMITTKDGHKVRCGSECSIKDSFCYRRGVQVCLESIDPFIVSQLNGTARSEAETKELAEKIAETAGDIHEQLKTVDSLGARATVTV